MSENVVAKQSSGPTFEEYGSGGIVILEANTSFFVLGMLSFAFLIAAVSIGIWASDKYSSHTTEKSHDNVIYINYAISAIALVAVIALIIYWFVLLARRNKNKDQDKLEEEAAKLFAHAYGERAKLAATESSKSRVEDFKQVMYRHLANAFKTDDVRKADINDPEKAAKNISDEFKASVVADERDKAAAAQQQAAQQQAAQQQAAAEKQEAADNALYGETTYSQQFSSKGFDNLDDKEKYWESEGYENKDAQKLAKKYSPISLSRASRRRKSPVKKKKPSPSSLKKKKKVASSRRK